VEAQDGSASVLEEIASIYKAPITHEIGSDRAGKITAMDAEKIGRASFLLGGGRQQVDDKIDLAVGISDLKKSARACNETNRSCVCMREGTTLSNKFCRC